MVQVYVWGRRNPYVQMSFLGLFNFTAPYLPWVLLGFSLMLGSSPVVDLLVSAALGTCSFWDHQLLYFSSHDTWTLLS